MIAIIDYDAGNIRSVEKALTALGEQPVVTRDKENILAADKLILPGVMKRTPLLGICLGLQLLFERSDESDGVEGLGILKGEILKIPDSPELKIPHMGWNSLEIKPGTRLFAGIPNGSYVYFVHSYYLKAEDTEIVAATTEYSTHIHAAVEQGNVFACQFHPEKSSEVGLQILKNFISL